VTIHRAISESLTAPPPILSKILAKSRGKKSSTHLLTPFGM